VEEFQDEFKDIFQNALFFNKVETELAIFQAWIDEVHYFGNKCTEEDLDPELDLIRKEEFQYAYDQYTAFKETIVVLLEEYMIRIKETDIPVNLGYYKILQGLRDDN